PRRSRVAGYVRRNWFGDGPPLLGCHPRSWTSAGEGSTAAGTDPRTEGRCPDRLRWGSVVPPYLTNEQIRGVVGTRDGVEAARRALAYLSAGTAIEGGRQRYDVGGARLLNSMWAASQGAGGKVLCKTYITGGESAVRGANLTLLVYDGASG